MKVHPKIGELPRFGEHRMIGDPLEHLAELILQDRGHSFVFPPGLNPSFSGKAMKSCLGLTFALLCLVQAAGSAVARIAIDGNRSIGPAYTPDPSLVLGLCPKAVCQRREGSFHGQPRRHLSPLAYQLS
jgi:hypothetical protein